MATTATPATTARRTPVDWTRKYAFATGLFYLVTFAASIPAAFYFLSPVLSDPSYIVSAGADTKVVIGCLLDTVNALAGIATAVAFYPVARRLNESLAIGFVTTRMFEAVVIMVGVISLLAVVTLRQDGVGEPPGVQAGVDHHRQAAPARCALTCGQLQPSVHHLLLRARARSPEDPRSNDGDSTSPVGSLSVSHAGGLGGLVCCAPAESAHD